MTEKPSNETEIALLKQSLENFSNKIDAGFKDLKDSMENFATKSELKITAERIDARINALLDIEKNDNIRQDDKLTNLNNDFKAYQITANKRSWQSNTLTMIVSVVITALVVYILTDIGVMK